jgi:ribosome maturation factor RimP
MNKGVERGRLRQLIEGVVQGQGYEFVDMEFKGGGKNSVLRIFIDKPGGVTHRDCELVSEQVGTTLDVEDLIAYSYTLEVSSPGLDRKLTTERDYVRFEGSLAKVQTRIPLQNQKVFKGRLRGLQNGKIRLELAKGDLLEIPLDVVNETRLEFDWEAERARIRSAQARAIEE